MIYGDWIGRWAMGSPDKTALIDTITGQRYTYGRLSAEINKLAGFLIRELGIAKGDRVACLSFNRAEYIFLFFALSRLGAVLVPLNHRSADDELAYFLSDSEPRALFYDLEHGEAVGRLGKAGKAPEVVCFDQTPGPGLSLAEAWADLPEDAPGPVDIQPEDIQLIIYTSGTTGQPKGVILTHGMITWNAMNTVLGWDMNSADCTILHAAMFYTAGWNVFTLPLFMCRGTNILIRSFDADLILEIMAREKVTMFFGVPTMYQMLMDSPLFGDTSLDRLRFLVSGGAPLGKDLLEAYQREKGVRIWEGYGLTEIGPNNFQANGRPGTLGRPMPFVDVKIIDDQGQEVPSGEQGELLLRGPHCCAGYLNKPEATAEAIRDGWFHTGDLGRMEPDGSLAIVGRKKDMIISGGINIYPAEIERIIETHPAVAGVAVIGVDHPKWGEAPKAVVELSDGGELSLDELLEFLGGKLGRFKLPKYLAVVKELPRTPASGKVQKFILKQQHGGADNE